MSDKILNKRFVFTGEFESPRDDLKNKVLSNGGLVTNAISGKTNYLIIGIEPGPSKLMKAKINQIEILDEDAFHNLFSIPSHDSFQDQDIHQNNIQDQDIHIIKESKDSFQDSNQNNNNIQNTIKNVNTLLWTKKYEPQNFDQILGNKSAKENLLFFIQNFKKGKALLIHGSPGTGKTLSVKLAAKKLNKNLIEFNASDLRNKNNLKEKISSFTNTNSLRGERILLMDECDGMTGDRGGLGELSQIIKKSLIPIICICNDKQKINLNCDEINFRKLETRQILNYLKEIVKKENLNISDQNLIQIINLGNNDLRFILNSLQGFGKFKKIISSNLFDETLKLFKPKKLNEKFECFFKDYSMIPLMIFENYLHSHTNLDYNSLRYGNNSNINIKDNSRSDSRNDSQNVTNKKNINTNKKNLKNTVVLRWNKSTPSKYSNSISNHKLTEYYKSSESISFSDLFTSISDWSLLPFQGFFSSILPTKNLRLNRKLEFSKELGNLSKKNKNKKIISNFQFHFLSKCDFQNFYFYHLKLLINEYLECSKNVKKAVNFLIDKNLLKSDLDDVIEMFGLSKSISTKNKSAITREYKKIRRSLPYSL